MYANLVIDKSSGLTKKAEPPPACGMNRDSGTDSANGGWLRRLVRPRFRHIANDYPPGAPPNPHGNSQIQMTFNLFLVVK